MTPKLIPQNPVTETLEAVFRGAAAILTPHLRAQRERWGSTDGEVDRSLPGDEILPEVRWSSTHAVTINARPEQVWPWIVQIGHGRGGFYSYEALENLLGCRIRNAETILPEFQHPLPGDDILMHPNPDVPHFTVMRVDAPSDFLIGNPPRYDPQLETTLGVTWLFHLEPTGLDCTRLIVRWREFYDPDSFQNRLWFGPLLIEQIDFVMETKMLEGIKRRVEASVMTECPIRIGGFELPVAR